jgi:hypothetical protein
MTKLMMKLTKLEALPTGNPAYTKLMKLLGGGGV